MYAVFMGNSELGDLIKQRRIMLKLSQRQLGAEVGITHQQVANIEVGKTQLPSPEVMQKFSAVLGIGEERLLQAVGFLKHRVGEVKAQYFPSPLGPDRTWQEIVSEFSGDEEKARRWLIQILNASIDDPDEV